MLDMPDLPNGRGERPRGRGIVRGYDGWPCGYVRPHQLGAVMGTYQRLAWTTVPLGKL